MSRQRDQKRGACYNAEHHWAEGTLLGETQTFDSLVAQTREIEATPEWQSRWSRPVQIGYNSGDRSWAQSGTSTISYIVRGSARKTVPHEMAHIITPGDEGHGREWRSAYIWIVRFAYGDDWADALAASFSSSKLGFDLWPVTARRTPVFPPAIFNATHGGPLFERTTTTKGPIAL